MTQTGISISLRVFHPTMDPDEISRELQLAPLKVLRPRDGANLSAPKSMQNYWTARIVPSTQDRLSVALDSVVEDLQKHAAFFRSVSATGGRTEFFIGWFLQGNDGDLIPASLMGKIAELKIDLSLCLYTTEQAPLDQPVP